MGTKGVLSRGPGEKKSYVRPEGLLKVYFPTTKQAPGKKHLRRKMLYVISHSDYKTFSTS